jgi:hypothetical protein
LVLTLRLLRNFASSFALFAVSADDFIAKDAKNSQRSRKVN